MVGRDLDMDPTPGEFTEEDQLNDQTLLRDRLILALRDIGVTMNALRVLAGWRPHSSGDRAVEHQRHLVAECTERELQRQLRAVRK